MPRLRSQCPEGAGTGVSTRPIGLSRRQFLRYTAVGAGVLAVGGTAAAEVLTSASTDEKSLLCAPKVFFVPFLEIESDPSLLQSPDIWVTATPDVKAPPLTDCDNAQRQQYFVVARIHNRGSAPVFNATVNLYVYPTFATLVEGGVSRFNFSSSQTQYASIQPGSDRLVLFPQPMKITQFECTLAFLVVECFDPLTDMIKPLPNGDFNLGKDRHVAGHSIAV